MEIVDRIRRFKLPGLGHRPSVVPGVAEEVARGSQELASMSIGGLRQRLENLDGVEAIHLELADSGLSGIRVSLAEGAEEEAVLERIRSLLVTYGLRTPTPVATVAEPQEESAAVITAIRPEGDGMRVEVSVGGESLVKVVEATPLAAAQAVAEGRAQLGGRPTPRVLWIGLDSIGDWRILTVLMRVDDQVPTVGASVVEGGWAAALDRAVAIALD